MHREIEARLHELNARWLELARDGDLERAWCVSDEAMGIRAPVDCSWWPRHLQFIWKGGGLHERRVLVRCYHGLGDTIQFVRFVPQLRRVARRVVLWAQPQLIPLLETMRDGPHEILPLHDGAPGVEYDVDVELAELMHALRVTCESIRAPSPYLLPDSLPAPGTARAAGAPVRVGLVWRAGEWSGARSIPCEMLAGLEEIEGVEWWLFQRGEALADWPHAFGHVPRIEGMLEEAKALRELDILISVDTCSAHLAGALAVPVWTLLPRDADWRWMRERCDSPWYPTMRLFRQRSAGEWRSVVDDVTESLVALVSSRGATRTPALHSTIRIASDTG